MPDSYPAGKPADRAGLAAALIAALSWATTGPFVRAVTAMSFVVATLAFGSYSL